MKIVFYDKETDKVLGIEENIQNPRIEGENIYFDGGSMKGINSPYIILDDNVELGENITDELMELDKAKNLPAPNSLEQRIMDLEMYIAMKEGGLF